MNTQTLELGGVMNTAPYHIESISQVIADGAFAQLETLLLDDRYVRVYI